MVSARPKRMFHPENLLEGKRYWIGFQSLTDPDNSLYRGCFYDMFLKTVLRDDKQLYAVFSKQGSIDVRAIVEAREVS